MKSDIKALACKAGFTLATEGTALARLGMFGYETELIERFAADVRVATLDEVLRGLRSENGSQQLRAIIASIEALKVT